MPVYTKGFKPHLLQRSSPSRRDEKQTDKQQTHGTVRQAMVQFVVFLLLLGFTHCALFEPTQRDWDHPIGFEGLDGNFVPVQKKSPLWGDVLEVCD